MKNYLLIILATLTLCISSCRKPRKGDYQMTLSGTKVTTNTSGSSVMVSTTPYSDSYTIEVKRSRKESVEVGAMTWKRSGSKVSYVSTNISFSNLFSGNWANGFTQTIANTYDGTIQNNSSIEGSFVFSITKVDNQSEEVQVTTGTFTLKRK